ncbi:MAG: hypothetical protein GYB68_19215, partial [Chloroflexi bacterium]|nr:hypothetical protein [Chloroflexota bacterium]
IIVRFAPPYDPVQDMHAAQDSVAAFKARLGGHVVGIWDLLDHQLDFSTMMRGLAEVTRLNPEWYENLSAFLVGDGFLMRVAAQAINHQPTYSIAQHGIFTTMQEALAAARDVLAERVPA